MSLNLSQQLGSVYNDSWKTQVDPSELIRRCTKAAAQGATEHTLLASCPIRNNHHRVREWARFAAQQGLWTRIGTGKDHNWNRWPALSLKGWAFPEEGPTLWQRLGLYLEGWKSPEDRLAYLAALEGTDG